MSANQLFDEGPVQPIEEHVLRSFYIGQSVLFVFTTIVYGLLMIVVLGTNKKQIGNYKYHIATNSTFSYGQCLLMTINWMQPLAPYPILASRGITFFCGSFGPKFTQTVLIVIFNIYGYCFSFVLFSTLCMFIYRFLHTTHNKWLGLLENVRNYGICLFAYFLFITVFIIIPSNFQMVRDDEIKKELKERDPVAYELVKNYITLGLNLNIENPWIKALFSIAMLTVFVSIFIMALCIFGTYRYLRKSSHMLRPKTVALFRSLINMLIIDLVFFSDKIWIGIFTINLRFFFNYELSANFAIVSLIYSQCYAPFSSLIVLLYLRPYRAALVHLLRLDSLARRKSIFADNLSSTTRVHPFKATGSNHF